MPVGCLHLIIHILPFYRVINHVPIIVMSGGGMLLLSHRFTLVCGERTQTNIFDGIYQFVLVIIVVKKIKDVVVWIVNKNLPIE